MAGHAGDPVLAAVSVFRQHLAVVAVDDIELDEVARRNRHRAGHGGGEGKDEQQATEHGDGLLARKCAAHMPTRGLPERGCRGHGYTVRPRISAFGIRISSPRHA